MEEIKTPFQKGRPGRWFELFLKHHPMIIQKHSEYLSKFRASISEEKVISGSKSTLGRKYKYSGISKMSF